MAFTSVKHVQVLVVDDDKTRGAVYLNALQRIGHVLRSRWEFEVHFCNTVAECMEFPWESGKVQLALVDMVLTEGGWDESKERRLDEMLLRHRLPVIAVSAKFNDKEANVRVNNLLVPLYREQIPVQQLLWEPLKAAVEAELELEDTAALVNFVLSASAQIDLSLSKADDEPLGALHLTDLHFGRCEWRGGDLPTLGRAFRKEGLPIADFLLLTGDVSQSGCPQDYEGAKSYFTAVRDHRIIDFASRDFPSPRILVCPGNHDFSRPLALAANITSVSKVKPQEDDVFEVRMELAANAAWMLRYASAPFRQFVKGMTGRTGDWLHQPGFAIDARFRHLGVLFVELAVEKFEIKNYQQGITDAELSDRLTAASAAIAKERSSGDCVVVLAHRYSSDLWSKLKGMIDSFLGGLGVDGPVVYCAGHEHGPTCGKGDPVGSALIIRGAPSVDAVGTTPRVAPSANYIQLQRKGGRVCGVHAYRFEIDNEGWRLPSGGARQFEWTGDQWKG